MALTFWLSIAFVAYVYAGYPVLLRVWATSRARRRPGADLNGRTGLPGVSIVIAARNEAARLGARLDNLRSLDYPPGATSDHVVSDGSTDGTADVAARYRPFVELIEVSHGGKALALNAGVARAQFNCCVCRCTAEIRAGRAAPARGAVCGPGNRRRYGRAAARLRIGALREPAQRKTAPETGEHARGIRTPNERRPPDRIRVDDRRRRRPVLAIRKAPAAARERGRINARGHWRDLCDSARPWSPLPDGTILDDVLTPMRVVMSGFRVVFEERAHAFDRAPADAESRGARCGRSPAISRFWVSSPSSWRPGATRCGSSTFAQDLPAARAVCAARGILLEPRARTAQRLLPEHGCRRGGIPRARGLRRAAGSPHADTGAARRARRAGTRAGVMNGPLPRLARVAYAFVAMNYEAVAGALRRGDAATDLAVTMERLTFNVSPARVLRRLSVGSRVAAAPPRPSRVATAKHRLAATVRERYDWDYLWMIAFTAVLFFRPQDHVTSLTPLHLAELTAIAGLAAMAALRMTSGQSIARINPEVVGGSRWAR